MPPIKTSMQRRFTHPLCAVLAHSGGGRPLRRFVRTAPFSAQTPPMPHTQKSPVRISATRRCGQGFLLVADRIQGRISCLFEKQRNRNVADRQKVCLYSWTTTLQTNNQQTTQTPQPPTRRSPRHIFASPPIGLPSLRGRGREKVKGSRRGNIILWEQHYQRTRSWW